MAQTIPNPGPADVALPRLDCERLDCFRAAVDFQALAARLASGRRLGAVRDQLDRASLSIALNIAEGVGRRSAPDKAHFFAIARGSASECAGILDILLSRGLLAPADHRHGRGLLVRIVQMLTRLIARQANLLEAPAGGRPRPLGEMPS
jgi:four helix bundle protein